MGIVVSLGGQTAINLAPPLHALGVPIIGTDVAAIDRAENRDSFEKVMEKLGIPQPKGLAVTDIEEGVRVAASIGYPVLVRPSFVLGGRAMQIVANEESLRHYLQTAVEINTDQPVLVDKYLMGKEVEVDAVCDGEEIVIPGIMQHVERAGIHSGDSISVYPAQTLSPKIKRVIEDYTRKLANSLHVIGLINIQFIAYNDEVYVIEVNPRVSRSSALASKATGYPIAKVAAKIALGYTLDEIKNAVTGKTYASIERLMEAESGVYLAPLRLLALEIQDKLNSQNIACSLLTGEEEDILNYAYHVSSTIEKLQLGTPYDVCVIDEAQMIADKQRGWAWTRAILGVLAPEIHICMAPEALDIVIKLIKDCNDTYEVIKHTRDTELVFEDEPFNLNKDVKKGDALVVFGKKKALAVSAQLLNNNIKTSIIYGSLPYSTRKKQFERFLDGETEVIVCTDAIGMGVNLPIKRIVFLETRKYDGVSLRKLNVSEIKQIAGRAGRKGIYDKGYVTAMSDRSLIKDALTAESNKIKKCYIGVPNSLLDINIDIIDALKTWSTMFVKGHYEKTDVTMIIFLLNKLKKLNIEASKEDLLKMATIPFEENNKAICALWEEYCMMYSQGAVNLKKPVLKKNVSSKKELDELECYYKSLELNYSFGKNFNMMINNRFIALEKEETANKINELLLTKLLDHERVCSICGKKLAWDCASDKCRICREMIQGIKSERYKKPVFRGGRRSSRFSRDRRNRR